MAERKGCLIGFSYVRTHLNLTAPLEKTTDLCLSPNSVITILTGGGGGCGDPFDRDLEKVRTDVIREYLTDESAKNDCGVVIDPKTLEIKLKETQTLRQNCAQKTRTKSMSA